MEFDRLTPAPVTRLNPPARLLLSDNPTPRNNPVLIQIAKLLTKARGCGGETIVFTTAILAILALPY